jgi:molybdenum cofactor biosynthesis enzyme
MREMLTLLRIIDQTVDEKTPKSLEAADTIAVTCLLGDLTWLMNIYDMLKASDRKLILHIPSKIWLDSSTLEQAYTDYEKHIRLTAKLKKLGIEIRYINIFKQFLSMYA